MSFRAVQLLWLLAMLPVVLAFLVAYETRRLRIANRFASERIRGGSSRARKLRPWLLTLALALAIVGLAGPHAGVTLVPIATREANRVLVIDVSNSMAAEDVGTSRLSAGKALAMQLAQAQHGRVALLVFEAEAEVVSPLTTDTDAVSALIDTVVPGEIGQPGSDLGSAILAALRLIENDVAQNADIVVISDGEEQGKRIAEAVQRAKSHGVQISTIVVGSAKGGTIPTGEGTLRDEKGEIVTTYARTEVMREVASETGGTMLENPFAAGALEPLLRNARPVASGQTHVPMPVDRYQWPLALALAGIFSASLLHRGAE